MLFAIEREQKLQVGTIKPGLQQKLTKTLSSFSERECLEGEKVCFKLKKSRTGTQQNIPITTGVITTKAIIMVIHLLLYHLVKNCCKS